MLAELPAGADGDRAGELLLRDGLVGQRVHAHGDLEVVQVVQEQAEVLELREADAHFVLQTVNQTLQDLVVLLGVEEGVPKQ